MTPGSQEKVFWGKGQYLRVNENFLYARPATLGILKTSQVLFQSQDGITELCSLCFKIQVSMGISVFTQKPLK